MKSISNIKRLLKIKEDFLVNKISKINETINKSKSNVEQIENYQVAYIKASRQHANLSAYEIQNTQKFVKNLINVVENEKDKRESNDIIKKRLVVEWESLDNKIKKASEKEIEAGIDIALEDEEEHNNKLIERLIINKTKEKLNG